VLIGLPYVCRFAENTVYVTTLPVTERTQHLAIELELTNGSRIDTGFTFDYRNNPVFNDIEPSSHLTM